MRTRDHTDVLAGNARETKQLCGAIPVDACYAMIVPETTTTPEE